MENEETVKIESAATPEVQKEAEANGWIPPDRFRDEAEKFVDADEYMRRTNEVLPIVKRTNERLRADLTKTNTELLSTKEALKKAQESIDAIEERHSAETARKVQEARDDVKASLAAASEAGDHKAVAELTDQLTQLNVVEEKPVVEKKDPLAQQQPEIKLHPEMPAWLKDNEWFGKDKRRTALAGVIAQELRDGGETVEGRAFFDKVTEGVFKDLPLPARRDDKVEGNRNGGDSDTRPGNGAKNYNHLNAEAKAACDADCAQRVGPTKRYKTLADARAGWAAIYFAQG